MDPSRITEAFLASVRECQRQVEENKDISKSLKPLGFEVCKYDDFEKYSGQYSWNLMRGRYWHITDDPNFTIKNIVPRDLSSMGSGGGPPGLMVSYTPSLWHSMFEKRKYAAEIDLSKAIEGRDFTNVNRGFGHEIFINNLGTVSVKRVTTVKNAVRAENEYNRKIPQSEDALCEFWNIVHK